MWVLSRAYKLEAPHERDLLQKNRNIFQSRIRVIWDNHMYGYYLNMDHIPKTGNSWTWIWGGDIKPPGRSEGCTNWTTVMNLLYCTESTHKPDTYTPKTNLNSVIRFHAMVSYIYHRRSSTCGHKYSTIEKLLTGTSTDLSWNITTFYEDLIFGSR